MYRNGNEFNYFTSIFNLLSLTLSSPVIVTKPTLLLISEGSNFSAISAAKSTTNLRRFNGKVSTSPRFMVRTFRSGGCNKNISHVFSP